MRAAHADILNGSYSDYYGAASTSGAAIAEQSGHYAESRYDFHSYHAAYSGDVSNGTLAASAVAGVNFDNGSAIFNNGSSQITYTTTITNTGTSASLYNFTVNLKNSHLEIYQGEEDKAASATIGALVAVNGTNIWSTSALLQTAGKNNASYDLTATGPAFVNNTVQVGYPNEYKVDFANYSSVISLGMLAAGASETVSYTLYASALETGDPANNFLSSGYGGGIATIGDPFGVSGSPSFSVAAAGAAVTSAVPEEDAAILMAAGLVMVGALSRRRRAKGQALSSNLAV